MDEHFVVFESATGRQVGLDAIVQSSHTKQVLLVGEFHDDPHAHAVESQLFSMLLAANGYPETVKQTSHSPPVPHVSFNNHLRGMGAPDVMMGLSGAPNLWTALHDGDPALQVQPAVPVQATPPEPPSAAPLHPKNDMLASRGRPDCFQSLSGLKPGVMSACCNSSLGTAPGGSPSLASAAASAATADAVRPFIRGGYNYMSKSFSNLYGMVFTGNGKDGALTSPPSFASDLDSLGDDISHHTPSATPPGPSRPDSPFYSGTTTPPSLVSSAPSTASNPSPCDSSAKSSTTSPGSASTQSSTASGNASNGGTHTHAWNRPHGAQPHALPYSPWSIFTSTYSTSSQGGSEDTPPARQVGPTPPLYAENVVELDNITKSAVRNHEVLSSANSTFGSALRGLYSTHGHAYQRSPLSATPHSSGAFTTSTSSESVVAQDAPHATDTAAAPVAISGVSADPNAAIGMHYGGCWQFPQISPSAPSKMTQDAEAHPKHTASVNIQSTAFAPATMHGNSDSMHAPAPVRNGLGLSLLAAALHLGDTHNKDASSGRLQEGLVGVPEESCFVKGGQSCTATSATGGHLPPALSRQLYGGVPMTFPGLLFTAPTCKSDKGSSASFFSAVNATSFAAGFVRGECEAKVTPSQTLHTHASASKVPVSSGPQRKVVLSLEMFERDVQHVVDDYAAGLIPLKDLLYDGRAWPNFKSDYLPMVDAAAASGADIVAANAPRRYVSLVGRHGLSALPGATAALRASHAATTGSSPQQSSSCNVDSCSSSTRSGKESRGLPTAPDAIAPPSAALMSKIRREMMAAQQAAKREVPVCGTASPENSSKQVQKQTTGSAVNKPEGPVCVSSAPSDASSSGLPSSKLLPAKASAGGSGSSGAETTKQHDQKQETECPFSGMRLSDNFFAAQALWDATMADSILCALHNSSSSIRAKTTCPGTTHTGCISSDVCESPLVMHVCGKFHMEEGLGICEHLRRRRPEVTFATVAITPVDLPQLRQHMDDSGSLDSRRAEGEIPGLPCSLQQLKQMADFVVLTDGNTDRCF